MKLSTLLSLVIPAALLTGAATANHNTLEALESRIAAEGKLNVVDADSIVVAQAATAASTNGTNGADGAAVYNASCVACHGSGIAGAPKVGDVAAWQARIAQGMAMLVAHAIDGFSGDTGIMLPKGGNAALSDAEVEAAVAHMVEQSQ